LQQWTRDTFATAGALVKLIDDEVHAETDLREKNGLTAPQCMMRGLHMGTTLLEPM